MKNILFDTDIGCDCDDAGALVILKSMVESGDIRLLSVTSATTMEGAEHTIEAILRYYGMSVPIGVMTGSSFMCAGNYNRYARDVKDIFPCEPKTVDAVALIRKTLVEVSEACTLITVAPQRNLARFLASKGDDISPLNGIELAKSKLKEIVIMGGTFLPEERLAEFEGKKISVEWNIEQDISAARYVADNCPVNIVYCPFELGYDIETGRNLPKGSPARLCYDIRSGLTRASWDPCATYYGAFGTGEIFSLSDRGKVSFDEKGKSSFTVSENGLHRILQAKVPSLEIERELDDWMK